MLGFGRRTARTDVIARFHAGIVEASRARALYGPGALPDTTEGRFESLTLHVLLALRRLRALPAPADDVAQELVDAVFSHLEIALRESGIGDFGVPKRMKKLGRAFYDRLATYEKALAEPDIDGLANEIASRLSLQPADVIAVAGHCFAWERKLAARDLNGLLGKLPSLDPAGSAELGAP